MLTQKLAKSFPSPSLFSGNIFNLIVEPIFAAWRQRGCYGVVTIAGQQASPAPRCIPKLEVDVRLLNLNLRPASWIACTVLLAGLSGQARADYIATTLGVAGPDYYAVLALSGANNVTLSGPASTSGNVGISSGTLSLTGSSGPVVSGNVYLSSGATLGAGGSQVTGSVLTNQSLSLANTDALAAAAAFNQLTATQSLGTITGATTIAGASGVNVIAISGLNLSNATLTLNGPAGSQFIINDSGAFTLNSSQILLTGGVTSQDVVFNVTSSNQISTSGSSSESVITGNILAPTSNISLAPGVMDGELIAGGPSINVASQIVASVGQIHSLAVVVPPSTPEPPAVLLLAIGAVIGHLMLSRFRRKSLVAPA